MSTPTEQGLDAALKLQAINFAHSRVEFWKERYQLAQTMLENWRKEEERCSAISQGKPHAEKPYASIY